MYHIVKFYVATWTAIRMWALKYFVGSYFLCPLARYVIPRPSPLPVPLRNFNQNDNWTMCVSAKRPAAGMMANNLSRSHGSEKVQGRVPVIMPG